ncbi:leucine--tRNA ligase [Liberiplasma polymorphum]|uniref:leucine--tRNA ligase n=1 Tax=Liberiplasma polymorphum TaxID=3374570 RepID=UPI0037734C44
MDYNPKTIEQKWQKYWYDHGLFKAEDFSDKTKYYALVEFPYPSGAGMHVGHIRAYTSLEVVARKRRMEGYNVLFPIGFDAFGLPTENYAIKEKIHPRIVTDKNIKTFTSQLKEVGFSFDFDRIVDTTDPTYYKWTQWIFMKLFEHNLAYRNKTFVNFCPSCKVVLSNEESQGGVCDRCDTKVEQKEKDVWFLKITQYAQRLLDGLDKLETLPRIKIEQENWIGKSEGAIINFNIKDTSESLDVFTTRPDTLFGATFMVIAPEHPLLIKLHDQITNISKVHDYQHQAKLKTEFERTQLIKDKTGVLLEGINAINPANKKAMPIFVADYVMMGYGTGAIMAVPGHDQRDYEFAKAHNCDIVEVIEGGDISKEAYTDTNSGKLINSDFINGLDVKEAISKMITFIEENDLGKKSVNFKMKDWAFNRQRYWGEPIPIVHCDDCGMVAVKEEDLPVVLPEVDHFEPTDTGESPLANIPSFVNTTCPKCNKPAKRETDTMPQWAGSSWYFLRYADPKNPNKLADIEKLKYWMDVDWYNGGMEHVTRHVIYSRFWHLFLHDIGAVPTEEPYKRRSAQGLILGPDGDKMSKSKGNVVNPIEIIENYGSDTLRLYILFIGDYEQSTPWSDSGVKGARRFLDKVWRLFDSVSNVEDNKDVLRVLHKTISEVDSDIEQTKFNTAIAKLMALTNELAKQHSISKNTYLTLLKLLYPFAPHICEEIYNRLGYEGSMMFTDYPKADLSKMEEEIVTMVISINGKVRDKIEVEKDLPKETVEKIAMASSKIQTFINEKPIKKVIVVPNKLINIVL